MQGLSGTIRLKFNSLYWLRAGHLSIWELLFIACASNNRDIDIVNFHYLIIPILVEYSPPPPSPNVPAFQATINPPSLSIVHLLFSTMESNAGICQVGSIWWRETSPPGMKVVTKFSIPSTCDGNQGSAGDTPRYLVTAVSMPCSWNPISYRLSRDNGRVAIAELGWLANGDDWLVMTIEKLWTEGRQLSDERSIHARFITQKSLARFLMTERSNTGFIQGVTSSKKFRRRVLLFNLTACPYEQKGYPMEGQYRSQHQFSQRLRRNMFWWVQLLLHDNETTCW